MLDRLEKIARLTTGAENNELTVPTGHRKTHAKPHIAPCASENLAIARKTSCPHNQICGEHLARGVFHTSKINADQTFALGARQLRA
ncbi:MAG: hypothetical protein M0D54_10115 [Hyphomonadaceae bacterium JAD_PAG50586_4]|nr:MAG: hypothetical protein M0D54_10115 [Hyphomonadaceae bacterium JAD_PAG50586_4]